MSSDTPNGRWLNAKKLAGMWLHEWGDTVKLRKAGDAMHAPHETDGMPTGNRGVDDPSGASMKYLTVEGIIKSLGAAKGGTAPGLRLLLIHVYVKKEPFETYKEPSIDVVLGRYAADMKAITKFKRQLAEVVVEELARAILDKYDDVVQRQKTSKECRQEPTKAGV